MALDLTAAPSGYPSAYEAVCDSTANELRQVLLPVDEPQRYRVFLYSTSTVAYVTFTGTDNTAVGTNVKVPLPQNVWFELPPMFNGAGDTVAQLFIGSNTVSDPLKIMLGWRVRDE